MTVDNSSEVFASYQVGLPVYTWSATLLVVCNRKVRLLEGTIVRLVNSGVTDVNVITQLLGLDDRAIVLRTVQHLAEREVLSFAGGQPLHVTDIIGKEFLEAFLIKDERRLENVQIAYDPLRRTYCWAAKRDSYMGRDDLAAEGMQPMRPPYPLSIDFLPQNFRAIQELVRSQPERLRQHDLGKDVVRFELQEVLPAGPKLRFERGQLEVFRHTNGEWTYRIIREDGEDVTGTETLRAWEAGGHAPLPLQEVPSPSADADVKLLADAVAPLANPSSFISQEDLQRQELRNAIQSASQSLVIAPLTGTTLFSDDIVRWIERALNNTSELKVLAGVDEGLTKARRPIGPSGRQLAELRALQTKYPNRVEVMEMVSVPHRIIIVDGGRLLIQAKEFQRYSQQKYFQRDVLVPPFDATSDVGKAIKKAITQLLIRG